MTLEPLPSGDHAVHGKPRIAIWGDSHTAAGPFVETLLEAWGLPSGSTRPSFIPPSFGQRNVRLRGLQSCVSGQWRWRTAFRKAAPSSSPPMRMAKGLVALASETSGSTLGFDFRAAAPGARLRWLDIVFSKDDATRALVLGLRVNGGAEQLVFLYGGEVSLLRVQAEASGNAGVAIATLHLRLVAGQVTIEGLAPAYDDAPAAPTVDVFSVPGSTIAGWHNVDMRYLAGREADPVDYDLVLFQYGTNDALAHDFEPGEFARSMRSALSRLREVAPHARCVVIGPPDRGSGSRRGVNTGESRRLSQLHATVSAVQERVAAEFSCTFWNWQRAMGGPGAALRWVRMEPRLMQPDLVHLTAEGYAQSARALATVVTPRGKR
ncbi:MAG: GDSL-type esterase/lipase family protein [Rubrivivax sp.]